MARKEDMTNSLPEAGVFTLNETTVGKNGNNQRRSDVQLVQFFLRQFYMKHPDLFVLLPKTRIPSNFIIIDGKNGKQTEEGIKLFQTFQRNSGVPVIIDGKVSVPNADTTPTNDFFTILVLNGFFRRFGEGKEHHGNLENHPDVIAFAPELLGELTAARVGNKF